MFKKSENGEYDGTRVNCYEFSRCAYCVTKQVGVDACGPSAKKILEDKIADMEILLKFNNCTD